MGQQPTSSSHNTLSDAFGRTIAHSRSSPPPTLAERLDRPARLRALTADNEAGFARAISADFGHRSTTETTIAEVLFVPVAISEGSCANASTRVHHPVGTCKMGVNDPL